MRTLIALITCMITANLHAGVVFDLESKDNDFNPPQVTSTRVLVEGQLVKLRTTTDRQAEPTEMIFRGDRREMIVVDHRTRSFIVFDQAALQAMSAQMNQALGQLNQATQNMTPEQRALAGSMMNGRLPVTPASAQVSNQSPLTVNLLTNRATVYGFPSTLAEVRRDGRKISNIWVTSWQSVEGGQQLAPAFADMATFFEEFTRSLPKVGGMTQAVLDNPFSALHKINGLPVASRNYREDGTIESESALRNVQQASINAVEFQPPTGYQQNRLFGK